MTSSIYIQNLLIPTLTGPPYGSSVCSIGQLTIDVGEHALLYGFSDEEALVCGRLLTGGASIRSGHVQIGDIVLETLSLVQRIMFRLKTVGFIGSGLPRFSRLLRMSLRRDRFSDDDQSLALLYQLDSIDRVLKKRPEIMIAVEPTLHLNPHDTVQFIHYLCAQCAKDNITVLMMSSLPEVVSHFPSYYIVSQL